MVRQTDRQTDRQAGRQTHPPSPSDTGGVGSGLGGEVGTSPEGVRPSTELQRSPEQQQSNALVVDVGIGSQLGSQGTSVSWHPKKDSLG